MRTKAVTQKIKFYLIFIFTLLFFAIYSIYQSPINSNEISIYHGIPNIFWIVFFTSICLQIYLLLTEKTRYLLLSFILTKISFFSIPYIRGYLFREGDILDHYGVLIDLLNVGHTTDNWYPLSYIFTAQINIITEISLIKAVQYPTIFISSLVVIFSYLISIKILKGTFKHKLIFPFFIIFSGGYYIHFYPNGWALIFFTIIIYSFVIENSFSNKILQLLLLFTIILIHPLGALVTIILLLIFWLKNFKSDSSLMIKNGRIPLTIIALSIVSFLTFIKDYRLFQNSLQDLIFRMQNTDVGPKSRTFRNLERAAGLDLSFFDVIRVFLLSYYLFIFSIVIIFLMLYILKFKKERLTENLNFSSVNIFNFIFITFSIWFISQIGIAPQLISIGIHRLTHFIFPLIPIFFVVVVKLLDINKKTIFITLILLILFSSITLFNNPIRFQTNEYVMHSEQVGYMTLFDDPFYEYQILNGRPNWNLYASFGHEAVNENPIRVNFLPDGFGYANNDSMGKWIDKPTYIILTENNKERYITVLSSFNRYSISNYHQIETDYSVSKIYVNGQITKYYIE